MNFRVELGIFRGPMDLLLYLVRKHELEITEIPLASVTEQFLAYLEVLQELNISNAGEFLETASYLVELKSRMVLPRAEEEQGPIDDPREGLVQRLLEYKQYQDATSMLEERRSRWQKHYSRLPSDLPTRRTDPAEQPIREVELWDLVSAFGRVMRDSRATSEPSIVYDETPISTYMQQIHSSLVGSGRLAFSSMFGARMHKSALIGVFLAVLELVRHHSVITRQDELHGEIWLYPGDRFDQVLTLTEIDSYEHGQDQDGGQAETG